MTPDFRILILILLASVRMSFGADPSTESPNVLFIATDDLRDWVGCLGGYGGEVHTPNIDRLASRGVLFTNAHTASPVCCPSRAAIMSGRLPSSTGVYNNQHWWKPHRPKLVTLPVLFRQHGYETAGAGKIYHHTVGNNPPSQWDQYQRLVFNDDAFSRTSANYRRLYPYTTPRERPPEFPYSGLTLYSPEVDWGVLPKAESDMDDARTADFAITFLKRNHDRPFFLAAGIFRPHMPWYAPQKYVDMYPIEKIQLPPVDEDDLKDVPEAGRKLALRKYEDLQKVRAAGQWKRAVQMYLASISFADAQVGRILDALDSSPHAKNTIVVFWSDHGWHLGEKNHWHKRTLWDPATRVPLIVASPAHTESSGRCEEAVSLLDVYPTLAELTGTKPPQTLDGESLVPLLRNPSAKRITPAVTVDENQHVSVRDERYRYIRYSDGTEEIYDYATDPYEWINRSSDPSVESIRERLARYIPTEFAKAAPSKKAYEFDPKTYTWTNRKTGQVVKGKR